MPCLLDDYEAHARRLLRTCRPGVIVRVCVFV
jgi:hypothetical protein